MDATSRPCHRVQGKFTPDRVDLRRGDRRIRALFAPPATLAPRLSAAGTPVSHHMRVLVEAGLVRSEKRGRWVFYALVPEAFQMLIDTLAPFALHGVGVSDRPSPAGCRCG